MPLLQQICYLDLAIKEYDRLVRKLCKKYPATKILQQITGVGELTSLAFVLIVGDPNRFDNAARLCAYLAACRSEIFGLGKSMSIPIGA